MVKRRRRQAAAVGTSERGKRNTERVARGKEIALEKKQTTGVTTTQDEMKEHKWVKSERERRKKPP